MAEIPEVIGKYKILSLVAKGGMGAVYKAVHPSLNRHVVIKKLTMRGNAAVTERFKREAQILLDLNNPHIVHLYDYFKEGSSHYIVLEFVDGMSLDVLLRKKKTFSSEMALLVFLDACYALKYAHDHGIVHRDIKPANILISKKGEIKLADFGIASSEAEQESDLTREGTTLGTPSYMPPEQFGDSKNVDKRADIYAMGVMLYEMVIGEKPYPGNFTPETIVQIQRGRFTPPERINASTAPVVRRLIRNMIRPDPRQRFQDMGTPIRIIQRHLRQFATRDIRIAMVENMITDRTDEPAFKPRRKTVLAATLLTLAVALAGIGGKTAWDQGLIHRTLLRPWFTPVTVAMDVPSSFPDPSDLLFRAFFFKNDGNDIPEVPGTQRNFDSHTLKIDPVYLRPGYYRIKVVAGPRIWWQSLVVAHKRQDIIFDFGRIFSRSITVRTGASDALSGKDISTQTDFKVNYGGKWVALSSVPEGKMVAGTVWKFRAIAAGYVTEEFSLKIDWYQDELFLHASLLVDGNTK